MLVTHRVVRVHQAGNRPPAQCQAFVPAISSSNQHSRSLQTVRATQSKGSATQQSMAVYFREEDVLTTAYSGDDLIEVSACMVGPM